MSFFKQSFYKIKSLLGLQGYSDYFKRYFDTDNARSGIIISVIVMLLELFMICDTSRDVNAGKNIGCHSILINRSVKPSQDFGQEYTVINAMEILDLIQI